MTETEEFSRRISDYKLFGMRGNFSLNRNKVRYIRLDQGFCFKEPEKCKVPLDGHPSAFFNSHAARQLAGAIAGRKK